MDFMLIPSGSFLMGRYPGEMSSDPSESPQHEVTIAYDFYMAKYELTKAQWASVMGTTPWAEQRFTLDDPDSPAVWVGWDDAQDFALALNTHITNTDQGAATMRLPSEAEWEYACRAGTSTRFYWGDDPSLTQIGDHAWYEVNSWDADEKYAHVVGLKAPNAWGLYDMSGNVEEFCQDVWHRDYIGAPADGSAWEESGGGVYDIYKVKRGGDWTIYSVDCRSAIRLSVGYDGGNFDMGFRLARDGEPETSAKGSWGLYQ
jgi:formylglycine-generating enzyme required for sulfatase activity